MPILIDAAKRVLVQGITGREGATRTQLMLDYGTRVVAGVTPGKGGQTVRGVPVFDTVNEANETTGPIDASVLFMPAPLVKAAALEAIASGIKLLVLVPDRVPLYDVLEIAAAAQANGAQFVGPNTLGVLSPGQGVLGMMGGRAASASQWAIPGPVGITSRSGGMTTSTAYYLAQAGIGASTIVHVGGDGVVGLTHADVLRLFEADPQTRAVFMFGEIGTAQEEDAAALIEAGEFTKPLIAFIGGKAARSGMRFSHAGAIIEGGRGTHEAKVARLREAGAHLVERFADIPAVTQAVLAELDARTTAKPEATKPITELHWKTAITQIRPNEIRLRGHRIDRLMGRIGFSQAIFLALTGELPGPEVGRLLDAILVSSIDHGATPPSALAARTAASTGAPFNAALAAGLLSINQHHGGAIEACMGVIREALDSARHQPDAFPQAAAGVIEAYRGAGKRLPGFGHRIHTADPRTARLRQLAASLGLAGDGLAMLGALEEALAAQTGRPLPANVDGAIAAVLVDLNMPSELANTFFMMARLPGLVAHVHEEITRERPMRAIHPTDHEYDGPLYPD